MDIKTPHINAKEGSFAKTVLLPGDPLRSKFIAEKFLENAVLINNVRGVQGYTGYYKGTKVTVMASGMGMPSMGIYSYELYNYCGVENIIRIGSAGALNKDIKIKSIVIADSSLTNSNFDCMYEEKKDCKTESSKELLDKATKLANEMNLDYKVGSLYSTDTFYCDKAQIRFKDKALAVEMESAALYKNAKNLNKKALAIVTISDNLVTKESCSADERQNSFTEMMELALNLAKGLN